MSAVITALRVFFLCLGIEARWGSLDYLFIFDLDNCTIVQPAFDVDPGQSKYRICIAVSDDVIIFDNWKCVSVNSLKEADILYFISFRGDPIAAILVKASKW